MRRLFITFIFIAVLSSLGFAESNTSAGLGVHFLRYETVYLTAFSLHHQQELQSGLELSLGGEFAISTSQDASGNTVPNFLIPVNFGLNFTFPVDQHRFLFGTGLTPVFNLTPEADQTFTFYLGPYVRGAMRLRVHPIMSWLVEVQQDLLIGGDDWINTATRITTGINFTLGSSGEETQ